MPVDATVDTFGELTKAGAVLVDFWGPRCQPCLAMMPTITKLEKEAGGVVSVVKVNAPENRQVCRDLRVIGLPTYLLLRDGVELERLSGDVTKEDVERAFETLKTQEGGVVA
jgi:thioredoxin 1